MERSAQIVAQEAEQVMQQASHRVTQAKEIERLHDARKTARDKALEHLKVATTLKSHSAVATAIDQEAQRRKARSLPMYHDDVERARKMAQEWLDDLT